MRLYKQTELFLLSSCFLTPLLENSASPFHSPDCSIFCRHGCSVQVLSLHSQGSPLMIFRHVSRGFRSLLLPAGTQGVHLNTVGPFPWFTRRCKCKRKCEFKWVHASNANARKVRCASAVDDRHRKFSYALPSFSSVMVEDVDVIFFRIVPWWHTLMEPVFFALSSQLHFRWPGSHVGEANANANANANTSSRKWKVFHSMPRRLHLHFHLRWSSSHV